MSKWEAEFNQLMSSQRDDLDFDYGAPMQEAWDKGLGSLGSQKRTEFDEQGIPELGEYIFGMSIFPPALMRLTVSR